MLVLKILGIAILLASVVTVLHLFNEHCDEKFSYRFLTIESFFATATALALWFAGDWWRDSALQSGGDTLNGVLIMSFGVIVILGLVYFNFKHTNFVYGVGGTVLQISLFSALAFVGFFILILGLVLSFLAGLGTQRVRIDD